MEATGAGRTHQVSVVDRNLRDLLRLKDDDDNYRASLTGLTLGAVLGCDATRPVRVSPPVSRTLLDIIRDEESATKDLSSHNRKRWKSFRDLLRLRRAGAAWSSSSSDGDHDDYILQISDPISTPQLPRSTESAQQGNGPDNRRDIVTEYGAVAAANGPVMMRLAAALAAERELQRQRERSNPPLPVVEEVREEEQMVVETGPPAPAAAAAAETDEAAPGRMSLMALLEETDRQTGMLGSTLMGEGKEEDEEEMMCVDVDGDDDHDGRGSGEYVCCVCMVRHKGSAFIPCGHTFCRLCSRELWVSRGNCPLCNGFILEILDIF